MVSFCSIGSWLFGTTPGKQTWNLKMRLSKIGISSCFWGAPMFRCNVLVFLCVSLIEICKSLDFTMKTWKALFEVVSFQLYTFCYIPLGGGEITHEKISHHMKQPNHSGPGPCLQKIHWPILDPETARFQWSRYWPHHRGISGLTTDWGTT